MFMRRQKASLIAFSSEPEFLLDLFLASEGTFFEHTTRFTQMREVYDSIFDDLRSR